jgi:hypothetical protein
VNNTETSGGKGDTDERWLQDTPVDDFDDSFGGLHFPNLPFIYWELAEYITIHEGKPFF